MSDKPIQNQPDVNIYILLDQHIMFVVTNK